MNIFESINNTSNKASDIGERYIDKSYEYFKLKVFQQLSYTISMAGKALIIGAVLFIGLILLAIAGAIAIGELLQSYALGYLIVGALFLIIAFIIYKVRYLVDARIISKLQSKFFKS
ncbi:phage holin family protein [Gelidibacter mesophilus]|uniref:phage holin family protein n=1 Tax=Gelidibacter mesophilus TaxID=169050 RepID=UPI0003FD267F|nr:phage holin family protein [Gelidibacter mesophilus]